MLTIIESASNVWLVITVDGELRVYTRTEEQEWGELPLSGDSEQVDPEKSFMLEELYAHESDQEEDDGEGEPEGEEEGTDDEEEPDEGDPELAEDQESGDGEEAEPEEEEKPRRRRAAPKNARSAASRK